MLHCHHQNDSCIKEGSDESHFNVSLIVSDKAARQCPQTTTFSKRKETRSGFKPRSLSRLLAPHLLKSTDVYTARKGWGGGREGKRGMGVAGGRGGGRVLKSLQLFVSPWPQLACCEKAPRVSRAAIVCA